jgi:hypothetical protein
MEEGEGRGFWPSSSGSPNLDRQEKETRREVAARAPLHSHPPIGASAAKACFARLAVA